MSADDPAAPYRVVDLRQGTGERRVVGTFREPTLAIAAMAQLQASGDSTAQVEIVPASEFEDRIT